MRLFIALGIALLLNIACTSDSQTTQNSPEEAVKGLFNALKSEDFEQAKLYGTKSTQDALQEFATYLKMSNVEEQQEAIAPYKMNVSKVVCTEKDGTTTCKLFCEPDLEVEIMMVQQDDKWFAQMDLPY